MKRLLFTCILLLPFFTAGALGRVPEVRLDGGFLHLRANQSSLRAVLEQFQHAGVRVNMEPGIDAMVHGEIDGEPLESALAQLLESFNYLLYWEVIHGPLGPLPRLESIHVFRPGQRRAVRPLPRPSEGFEVGRNPLRPNEPFVRDELLIGVQRGTTAAEFRALLAMVGGTLVESIPELGIYRVRLPPDSDVFALVQQLRTQGAVSVAEPNYIYELPAPAQAPGDASTRTAAAPAGDGQDFVPVHSRQPALAIFDSGLSPTFTFDDSVVGRFDAMDPTRSLSDPLGHGTQMAMVASGQVVPWGLPDEVGRQRVPILAVRAFDDNGRATSVGIINAINYAAQNGARVINMSWGTEANSAFLRDAVRRAREQDIVLVASAGNEPTQRRVYPAAFDEVVAVSAMNRDGSLWERSNYGDFIAAAAPGTGAFPVGHRGPPGSYAGTSIASANVSRAFALYFEQNPGATAVEAERAFFQALTDAGPRGTDRYFGRGALDASAWDRFLGN